MKVLSLKAAFSFTRGYIFDKMYFVKKGDEEVIPRMFSTCLQMRISGPNMDSLRAMMVNEILNESGEVVAQEFKVTRDQAPESLPLVQEFKKDLTDRNMNDWWCVVPILLRSVASSPDEEGEEDELKTRSRLMYLRNKSWDRVRTSEMRRKSLGKPDIPDTAILHVAGDQISPPCLACPHLDRHVAGGCTLGMTSCLTSIGIVHKSQFVKNLEKYGKEVAGAGIQEDNP